MSNKCLIVGLLLLFCIVSSNEQKVSNRKLFVSIGTCNISVGANRSSVGANRDLTDKRQQPTEKQALAQTANDNKPTQNKNQHGNTNKLGTPTYNNFEKSSAPKKC